MFGWALALGCGQKDCPDGFLRDNDGNCLQASDESDADTDSDTDTDTDATPDPDGDRDADGVSNADESKLGTDPDDDDSDDDSYLDGWEVTEGTDPSDAESRIYQGYWPYNPDKNSYDVSHWASAELDVGEPVVRFVYTDQFGDALDVYDFAGHDKYVLLDVCSMWATPCQSFAKWLSGLSDPSNLEGEYPGVRDAIDDGGAYWITLLDENFDLVAPDADDIEDWVSAFPSDVIPVLAGDRNPTEVYVDATGFWPTLILLDEDLTIVTYDGYSALEELRDRL